MASPRPHRSPQPIDRVLSPIQSFMAAEASAGILLLAMAAVAMIWANLPGDSGQSYFDLWHTEINVSVGGHGEAHGAHDEHLGSHGDIPGGGVAAAPESWLDYLTLKHDLHWWINDALMAIFFLVVGLEIKRELLVGELSSVRKAAVPIVAAIGGMVGPALIYAALNWGTPEISGWGVPTATDIAFAVGVLVLLGKRVPLALKVFLLALAIVDDLGAVLVIALFYTESLHIPSLGIGFAVLALLGLFNITGVRKPLVYLLFGILVWLAFVKSGVHATIAGVLVAITVPASMRIDASKFKEEAKSALDRFSDVGKHDNDVPTNNERQHAVHALEVGCEDVQTPLTRLEHMLHPWVTFFIMPIFALANAGVRLEGMDTSMLLGPVALGVAGGLFFGKLIGVFGATFLAVKLGIGQLPRGVGWTKIAAVSMLAGIGFTMAMFVAGLAYESPTTLDTAKLGVLIGSTVSGVIGFLVLRSATKLPPSARAAQEAEAG